MYYCIALIRAETIDAQRHQGIAGSP